MYVSSLNAVSSAVGLNLAMLVERERTPGPRVEGPMAGMQKSIHLQREREQRTEGSKRPAGSSKEQAGRIWQMARNAKSSKQCLRVCLFFNYSFLGYQLRMIRYVQTYNDHFLIVSATRTGPLLVAARAVSGAGR